MSLFLGEVAEVLMGKMSPFLQFTFKWFKRGKIVHIERESLCNIMLTLLNLSEG